jgi:pimeloyl-ACP methyl ester carboxylesterase
VPTTKTKLADIELELFDSGAGSGRPILFLHGGGGFNERQPFVAPLSEQRRVVVPSHPGFGKSSLPLWLDSVDDIAHLYLELMDRLDLAKADLVGDSIGGWIAAEMASKAPERIRRMVLAGPVGVKLGRVDKLDIPDIFAMPQERVNQLGFHDPAKAQLDVAKLSDEQLTIIARNRETLTMLVWEPYMHNPKLRHRLHRARMPVLFLRGESDGLVSAEYIAGYARLMPNARIETVPRAGHAIALEQPEAFAEKILSFLEA